VTDAHATLHATHFISPENDGMGLQLLINTADAKDGHLVTVDAVI
jgi:hypothetical protein